MVEIIEGNLLESGCTFICHQVNAQGIMGSGIAKQIRDKWPTVYNEYKNFIDIGYDNKWFDWSSNILGNICWTEIEPNRWVVNFFSQDKYYPRNVCHTDYYAFQKCCWNLKRMLKRLNMENCIIGFPYKIGCGLAGGDWNIVYNIIEDEFKDYTVRIYKYNETKNN